MIVGQKFEDLEIRNPSGCPMTMDKSSCIAEE